MVGFLLLLTGGVGATLPPSTYGVSTGYYHTCSRLGRNLVCFGQGQYGQLGTGAMDNRGDEPNEVSVLEPVPFATTDTVKQVSAGNEHTCVLFSNGGVRCFGYGSSGQLGTGSTANVGDQPNEMPQLDFIAFSNDGILATHVSTGSSHTCVLFSNGGVRCFGYGSSGQLGTGSSANVGDQANQMSQLGFIAFSNDGIVATQVSAGASISCVLFANGGVRCFGYNNYGQLGRGNTLNLGGQANQMSQLNFIAFSDDGIAATQVSARAEHTCVLFANGGVRCFGYGNNGQLGTGSTANVGDQPNEMPQLDYVPIQVLVINALSPTSGHFFGGEPLTIYGNGFISTAAFSVQFDPPCTSPSSTRDGKEFQISATHAIITTPPFPCGPNSTVARRWQLQ
jgi:alpha-tubulin suppressor-like RCC1 family protein